MADCAPEAEDEDTKLAIALSLADSSPVHSTSSKAINDDYTKTSDAATSNGLSIVDGSSSINDFFRQRKTMEAERLARQTGKSQKRSRSITPPPLRKPKVQRLTQESPSSSAPAIVQPIANAETTISSSSSSTETPTYPDGTVKKTWAFGYERCNDIKIEEVLERSTLRTAVLSAFQLQSEWILSKIDFPRTKVVLVMQGKTEERRSQLRKDIQGAESYLRLCFPPMLGQVNCMHSKLMLLFHPHKLRVVVPSANLTNYDWGETGAMENTVFLIDLPRTFEPSTLTPFAEELLHFVDKKGLGEDIIKGLTNFDWSRTADMAFVHSVGGVAYGQDMRRTGLAGLSEAVSHLGLVSTDLQLDFAASSIGSLNKEYLQLVQHAATGNLAADLLAKRAQMPTPADSDIVGAFRIYFPTIDSVTASNGGRNGGGTICLQRSYFTSARFPQSCFRNYQSLRKGLLSHNKILYARADTKQKAWVYVGSANMSESAWGKFGVDRQSKELKITCRNWECGVLLTVRQTETDTKNGPGASQSSASTVSEAGDRQELLAMDVFDKVLPLPFQYPGDLYGDKQPWYFKEHFS